MPARVGVWQVCVCVTSGGVVVWLGMFGVAVLCWRGVAWRGAVRRVSCGMCVYGLVQCDNVLDWVGYIRGWWCG